MKFYGAFFLFTMLLALQGFYLAEVAAEGHGLRLRLALLGPALFGLAMGATVFLGPKLGRMSKQTAGAVLVLLGLVVLSSYVAIGELSRLIH